ncbi:MAG: branched-chain amino acid transport system ATP-binding protein, partial [Acidimicrobiia bacterium]|nr:branched-chain amino acid transport system ATP-binding protein [Acidimicrobiia bacterium]
LGWGRYYSLLTGLALVTTSVLNPDGLVGTARRLRAWATDRGLGDRFRLGAARREIGPWRLKLSSGREPEPGRSGPPAAPEPGLSGTRRARVAASGDAVVRAQMAANGCSSDGQRAVASPGADTPGSSPTARLEVRELSVRRGGVRAVDGVSFTVEGGRVVGLIGPNGAGKSSVVDAITGFVPARGTVELDGVALLGIPAHRRARIGLARTWQSLELFDDLSVAENVEVSCRQFGLAAVVRDLIGLRRGDASDAVANALEAVGLAGQGLCQPGELSFGQRRLAGLACVLSRRPRVALLDEPAAGLGAWEVRALGRLLRELAAAGVGVLLVDHDMSLVLAACDEVYVLDSGRVIARGTPAQIRRNPAVIAAYLGSVDEGDARLL